MYQWLATSTYAGYPVFALAVFVTSFAGVFVWAYWPRRADLDPQIFPPLSDE
jgi:hypothetical protein